VAILQDTLDQPKPADQIPCALNDGFKSFGCLYKEIHVDVWNN